LAVKDPDGGEKKDSLPADGREKRGWEKNHLSKKKDCEEAHNRGLARTRGQVKEPDQRNTMYMFRIT